MSTELKFGAYWVHIGGEINLPKWWSGWVFFWVDGVAQLSENKATQPQDDIEPRLSLAMSRG